MNRLPTSSFQVLGDALPAAAIAVDRDHRIVLFNKSAEMLFGLTRSAVQGHRLEEVAAGTTWLKSLLHSGATETEAEFSLTVGQRSIPVAADAFPLNSPGGSIVGALILLRPKNQVADVDRHHRQLEALAAIGEVAAGTIHEIRNPLTSISGFIQLLRGRAARGNDQTSVDYCTLIAEEIHHIDNILSDFLTLAKPQAAKYTKVNLGQLVLDVLNLLYGEAILSQVTVTHDLPAEPLWIWGNSEKIKEVLINLSRNAFQAMAGHGTLTITAGGSDASVHVTITDTGVGIAPEAIADIFKPFFTTKEAGTGLGLAICQRIMRDHNGDIAVTSAPGEGASFTLTFPRLLECSEDASCSPAPAGSAR